TALAARERHDTEVDRRAEPSVQAHLFVAETLAPRAVGEVEEGEPDRLLQLVRERLSDEEMRDVRLQVSHLLGPMRVERRPRHRLDELFLVVRHARSSPSKQTFTPGDRADGADPMSRRRRAATPASGSAVAGGDGRLHDGAPWRRSRWAP